MRVPVPSGGTTWTGGTPTKLIDRIPDVPGDNGFSRNYDVSPDGQRFVVVKMAGTERQAGPSSVVLVQHWDRELAARVRGK